MAKKTHLRVPLDISVAARLADKARAAGVSTDVYASTVLASDVLGFRSESAAASPTRDVGRPVSPEHEDVNSRIERNAGISSGFVGVYARGKRWVARWVYEELGRFSTPELAAIVRYWFEQGRRSVARDSLIATGTPRDEALRLSRYQGDGAPLVIEVAQTQPPAAQKRGRPPRGSTVSIAPETLAGLPDPTLDAARAAGSNGGGPLDTTYSGPPEDLGSRPGGKAPASPESLRWAQKFRQPMRMVDLNPPPPKPLDPGSDPEEMP